MSTGGRVSEVRFLTAPQKVFKIKEIIMNNFFNRLSESDLQKVLKMAGTFVTPKLAANMQTANKMYNWSHRFFSLVSGKAGRSFEDGIMTLVLSKGCDESAKISKVLKKAFLDLV